MTQLKSKLLPKDIDLKASFMGTEFKSMDTEIIARNIVYIQKEINPEKWTPFSFIDYGQHCTHKVEDYDKVVLEALVKGGKPVLHTTVHLQSGYLEKKNNKYHVTDKFLKVLSKIIEGHKQKV